MAEIKGACLCQGVIFEITGDPEIVLKCYCDHCQKNAGGPYQIVSFHGGRHNLHVDIDVVSVPNSTKASSR